MGSNSLALNGLDHDARLIVDPLFHGLDVAVRRVTEPSHERTEPLVVFGLRGGGGGG